MWCDVDVSLPRDWLPRCDVDAVSSWAGSMFSVWLEAVEHHDAGVKGASSEPSVSSAAHTSITHIV